MLKQVESPQRFGVPVFENAQIIRIEEKPANPASNYAVTGIYAYDSQVFDMIQGLKPSWRNELEITDINNFYLQQGQLEYDVLSGWWSDAGTFESLQLANHLISKGSQHV